MHVSRLPSQGLPPGAQLGLLGYPIERSLSPGMYLRLFEAEGIEAPYRLYPVPPEALADFFARLRETGGGVHVTCPYKERVLAFCDSLGTEATQAGAANVVISREGRLCGENTDGAGYLDALRTETGFEPAGQVVGLLGAGGAARGAAAALAGAGIGRVLFFNRNVARAVRAAESLGGAFPGVGFEAYPLETEKLKAEAPRCGLLVNATSAEVEELWSRLAGIELEAGCLLSDMHYEPEIPRRIQETLGRAVRVTDGRGMLVRQGAYSLPQLVGVRVSVERLEGYLPGLAHGWHSLADGDGA